MTLKESKKDEKADREFQKKFKVSSKERLLIPLHSPSPPGRAPAVAERSCALQTPALTQLTPALVPAETPPVPASPTDRSAGGDLPSPRRATHGSCFSSKEASMS